MRFAGTTADLARVRRNSGSSMIVLWCYESIQVYSVTGLQKQRREAGSLGQLVSKFNSIQFVWRHTTGSSRRRTNRQIQVTAGLFNAVDSCVFGDTDLDLL